MPVIGRLDGQVEEIIIKPVGRRHAPDHADAPESAPAAPTASHDESLQPQHVGRPETPCDRRRDDEELPVWLL